MKKITLVLFALISGNAFAQSSASGSADVKAEIVSPITISVANVLDFGKIASVTGSGGNVTISPVGSLSYTNPDMSISRNVGTVPTFTVSAQYAYNIQFPSAAVTIKTLDESGTMTLTNFKTGLASNNSVSVSTEDFNLGATLIVGPGQLPGKYTGEVAVTVSYE